jgi:hypothetical protein
LVVLNTELLALSVALADLALADLAEAGFAVLSKI